MRYVPENPLIVQGDQTILLEALSPRYEEARDALLAFAELVKSPEYIHTWRMTALSLWNAAAAGHTPDSVVGILEELAKYPLPDHIPASIHDRMGRYGRLKLFRDGTWLRLEAEDAHTMTELRNLKPVADLLEDTAGARVCRISPGRRGEVKQLLTSLGHPVQDLAGFDDGDPVPMSLALRDSFGKAWSLRDYQLDAVDAFAEGPQGGSGVVVLPCGAGKTLVGVAAMARLGMRTLILCTGHTALRQWKQHVLDYTTLTEEDVGEYAGAQRELRRVTLTTYQLLTWRKHAGDPPAHFRLFHEANWGLVIYDEVHLLPAPIFRETAYLQARRRLGLTATLVREDGREADVFSLVGPKRYDMPWKRLEQQGWIASAQCVEIRVPFTDVDRGRYVVASARSQSRMASMNPQKGPVVERLISRHAGESIVILGTYLDQLNWISRKYGFPVITGKTPVRERDALFSKYRSGEIKIIGLSRVGNFAVDLPSASVAIQISGTFGSRQEEAQRLGRVLRPKAGDNRAVFYSLVTADSREQEYAERRQRFLAEQGYPYRLELAS